MMGTLKRELLGLIPVDPIRESLTVSAAAMVRLMRGFPVMGSPRAARRAHRIPKPVAD